MTSAHSSLGIETEERKQAFVEELGDSFCKAIRRTYLFHRPPKIFGHFSHT